MLMSSSKLLYFFEQSSFRLRYETVIGIVLCFSHQTCCLLYYLYENNNSVQCPVILLFLGVVVVLDLSKNICGSTDLVEKRHGSADCIPLFTPSISLRCSRDFAQEKPI